VARAASAQALVAFRGNRYSVPAELARAQVTVTHRLGAPHIDLATASGSTAGIVIARHTLAPPGAGATVRDTGHVQALEHAALSAFTTAAPHRRKQRIPPGPAARAAAAALRANGSDTPTPTTPGTPTSTPASDVNADVVVDLARYAAAAQGRNTLR
jgi:threonine aldolase